MAKLGLDTTAYQAGMKRAEGVAVAAGQRMRASLNSTAANYLGAAAVAALTKRTVDYASTLSDVSDRLDVSTESLQKFYWAAEKSGGSVEGVNTFLEKFAENKRLALLNPTGQQADAFTQFGITVDELRNGRIEDLTRKIGKMFEAGDPQKLIGALKQIGGRGAGAFSLALISGLQEAGEEAQRLGMIMEESTVQKLDAVGDKAAEVGKRVIATVAEPLSWLFDKLNDAMNWLQHKVDWVAAFWVGNQFSTTADVFGAARFATDTANENQEERMAAEKAAADVAASRKALRAIATEEPDDTIPNAVSKTKAKVRSGVDDPLAKIGGLFLGADAAMRSLGEKQLSEAKKSNRHLEKISGALSKPIA